MRRLRIQFTVRRIMILVAIVAVALGANEMRRKRDRFDALRSTHEWSARTCLASAELHASTAAANEREAERLRTALRALDPAARPDAELSAQIASNIAAQAAKERDSERAYRVRARFHEALRVKYERAAHSPWLLVPPDPPIPE